MSVEELYRIKNEQLQEEIRQEIEKAKNNASNRELNQLYVIQDELKKMMCNKDMPLIYPRMIIDSWDYEDKLGNELMELAKKYRCCK